MVKNCSTCEHKLPTDELTDCNLFSECYQPERDFGYTDYLKWEPEKMKYLEEFKEKIDITGYGPKEIYYSEMYAFYRVLRKHEDLCKIKRIIESGTFMGKSTSMLAKLFPDAEIITYEYRKDRYEQAAQNLEEFANVKCVHGQLGPKDYSWSESDAVIIDGPKHKDAIALAVKIRRSGDPACIAIHDMWRFINYLKKRFNKVSHSGKPSDEIKELDKNIPYKKSHHNDGFYGCTLAIVK